MNVESKKFRIMATMVTLLLTGTIIYLVVKVQTNGNLKDELNAQKLKTESRLSEKLSLEKDMLKLRSGLDALYGTNKDLDNELMTMRQHLESGEQEFKRLQKQGVLHEQLKKQYRELRNVNDELAQQLAWHVNTVTELKATHEDLNKTIASLEQKNNLLVQQLHTARMASLNDIRVESLKRNERLTINARKTRKLLVYADVPVQAENLTFIITGPSGKELTAKDGAISSRIVNNYKDTAYTASVREIYAGAVAYKEVEMTFTPARRLAPGIYTIAIVSNNMSIGSLQVKYR